MKPIVTALGICALLFGAQTANAIDWEGDRIDGSWSEGLNWSGGVMPTCTDPAVITSKVTHWPFLDGVVDRYVASLTMGGSADLDTDGTTANDLYVNGTFTVNGDSTVSVSGSTGHVYAEQILINGGTSGTTVTVSMTSGGSVETVADFDCP